MSASGATTIAMRGAGYYSSNTVGAKTVIDKLGDLVVAAIARDARDRGRAGFRARRFRRR